LGNASGKVTEREIGVPGNIQSLDENNVQEGSCQERVT